MHDAPLKNWIPYKLGIVGGQLQCHWLNSFGTPFREPFFEKTILKCRGKASQHAATASVSELMMIKEWAGNVEAIQPNAFIFHISRCGSTLVSQLLATSNQNIVLAEVPFFDNLLRLPLKDPRMGQQLAGQLLTSAMKYYGQKKNDNERHLFIKTDSWHIFFYKQFRQLYPTVPFIFIYRSPDEVFHSHGNQPGMQAVPGLIEPELFGFDLKTPVYDRNIYLANVLESYFVKYLEIIAMDPLFLLLNYNEGAMTMVKKITAFVNISLTPQDLLKMEERSHFHSKKPGEPFAENISSQVPTCLIKAMDLYNRLEGKRQAIN